MRRITEHLYSESFLPQLRHLAKSEKGIARSGQQDGANEAPRHGSREFNVVIL